MIFENAILKALWMDFGRVLRIQNPGFFGFLDEKMKATNENAAKKRPRAKKTTMNAPRAKNSENEVRRRQFPGSGGPSPKACYNRYLQLVY